MQSVPANSGAGRGDANSVADKSKLVADLRKAVDAATVFCATRPVPELSADERAEDKKVARELPNRLKQLLFLNGRQKSTARSQPGMERKLILHCLDPDHPVRV